MGKAILRIYLLIIRVNGKMMNFMDKENIMMEISSMKVDLREDKSKINLLLQINLDHSHIRNIIKERN